MVWRLVGVGGQLVLEGLQCCLAHNSLRELVPQYNGPRWKKRSWYVLLSDRQHAFRKSYSCETQLARVIDDWAKILDSQGQVDTFILDFEKAFDTPPHELLKSNLFS